MRLTEFVRRFKPRDDRFFDALERHGELLGTASGCLVALADRRTSADEAARAVSSLEPESAARLRTLEAIVAETYGTPLDPGDLHALGQGLHDIVGGLDVALGALPHLGQSDPPPYLRAQLRHLGLLVGVVARDVPHLRAARYGLIARSRAEVRNLVRAANESFEAGVHGSLDAHASQQRLIVRVLAAHESAARAVESANATASRLRAIALKYT